MITVDEIVNTRGKQGMYDKGPAGSSNVTRHEEQNRAIVNWWTRQSVTTIEAIGWAITVRIYRASFMYVKRQSELDGEAGRSDVHNRRMARTKPCSDYQTAFLGPSAPWTAGRQLWTGGLATCKARHSTGVCAGGRAAMMKEGDGGAIAEGGAKRSKTGAMIRQTRRVRGRQQQHRSGRSSLVAQWNGVTLAQSDKYEFFDGRFYFPGDCVRWELLKEGDKKTKHFNPVGLVQYYDVEVGKNTGKGAARRFVRVKKDWNRMLDYVCFWKGVSVTRAQLRQDV